MLSPRNRRRLAKKGRAVPSPPATAEVGLNPARTPEHSPTASIGEWFNQPSPLAHMPRAYRGPLYLYLEVPEYAHPWMSGGQVPIFPARKYLSQDRAGIYTPDELRQRSVGLTDPRAAFGLDSFGLVAGSMTFVNCTIQTDDGAFPLHGTVKQRFEDAYVLCFATERSARLMERLGKRVCVEILEPAKLVDLIGAQIQQRAFSGLVAYTDLPDRSHFLKSAHDRWQREYRLVWLRDGDGPIWVNLPPGVATMVDLSDA